MRARVPKFVLGLPLWQMDVAAGAVICLAAGVWYFAGMETLSGAQAAREALEAELAGQREIAHAKAKLAATQNQQLLLIQADIDHSTIQLHRMDKLNQRVSAFTKAAEDSGLRIDEIRPSAPTVLARFTVVPIRISGRGDYPSIMEFFRILRGEHLDTGVSGFSLEQKQDAGGEGEEGKSELQFVLNLAWYAAPDAPPVTK